MKKTLLLIMATALSSAALAIQPIKLLEPNMNRGKSFMQTLSDRQSVRSYAGRELSQTDLSDLLWAANGINRPATGKRTAPSAMDRQDIKIYVLTASGSYLYNHKTHTLDPIAEGDFRQRVRGNLPAVNLVLVADDGNASLAEVNAGYVSQNIYLACTSLGLATVACGTMDEPAFKKALNLSGKQKVIVWHPVGYPAN